MLARRGGRSLSCPREGLPSNCFRISPPEPRRSTKERRFRAFSGLRFVKPRTAVHPETSGDDTSPARLAYDFSSETGRCKALAGPGWSKTAGSWRASAEMTSIASANQTEVSLPFEECATGSSDLRDGWQKGSPSSGHVKAWLRAVRSQSLPTHPKLFGVARGECQSRRCLQWRHASGSET